MYKKVLYIYIYIYMKTNPFRIKIKNKNTIFLKNAKGKLGKICIS